MPKITKGCRIKMENDDGTKEEHCVMKDAQYSEWNDIVPFEITTCCGLYLPTSSADGYWKNHRGRGGWEIIGRCQDCDSKELIP